MLAKARRLPVGDFFGRRGQVVRLPYAIFRIFPAEAGYPRFGVVVPKKSFATAVLRNRLKRAFFGAAREVYSRVAPRDVLLTLLPPASDFQSSELREKLVLDFIRYLSQT